MWFGCKLLLVSYIELSFPRPVTLSGLQKKEKKETVKDSKNYIRIKLNIEEKSITSN